MAQTSVFNTTRFTALAAGDVIPVVDVDDVTQSAHGSLDSITITNFFATIPVPVTVTAGTVTASTPVFDATETWNAGGVTFTGIRLNVTSTASAAASLLADLQIATVSQWKVTKAGASTQLGVATATGFTVSGTSGKIIASATSLLIRDNADANTNVTISDSGVLTARSNLISNTGQIGTNTNTDLSLMRNSSTMVTFASGSIAFSSGNTVSITLTAGTASFTAGANGATNPALQVDASTASSATGIKIKSAAAAAGVALSVITSGTNENLTIDAAAAGTVSVCTVSTGSFIVGRLVDLSGAAAGQIAFPATQNASAGANTLDDYEEGTWTPTDQSGAALTFTSVTGSYVKIGKLVYVNCALTYPSTVDGSNTAIGSLPFTSDNIASNRGGWIVYCNATTARYFHPNANDTKGGLSDSAGAAIINSTMSLKTITLAAVYRASA